MLELISGILSLGAELIVFIFNIVMGVVIATIMAAKGRNPWIWGILGFIFPWIIFGVWLIPAKQPKLHPDIRQTEAFRGLNPLVASIMALSGMVAKSDGHVSTGEVQLVRQFVQRSFGLSAQQLNAYAAAFDYGKNTPENFHYFTETLKQYRHYNTIMSVAYLLVGLALEDGEVVDDENSILRQILAGLGIHEYQYQSMMNHYRRSQGQQTYNGGYSYGGSNYSYNQYGYGGAAAAAPDLTKKYSDVLGVSEDASLSEIKKAYRKLAKENHPDRMAQDGMPESYKEFANERIAEINEAYDYLKERKTAAA